MAPKGSFDRHVNLDTASLAWIVDVRSPIVLPNPMHVLHKTRSSRFTITGATAECCSVRRNGYSARLVRCMRVRDSGVGTGEAKVRAQNG